MVQFLPGERTDSRTLAMLKEAEAHSKSECIVVQGSWSDGSLSAGTHSGSGAVDLRTWHLSPAGKTALVNWLRRVGFAAWLRYTWQGPWGEHIHAVAIGNNGLAWSAANQVTAYKNGRDGLAANREDYHWRPSPIPTWESYKGDRSDDQELPDTGTPEQEEDDPLAFIDGPEEFRELAREANIQTVRDEDEYLKVMIKLFRKLLADEVIQDLLGNAVGGVLRDGPVARREMIELAEAGAANAKENK